MQESFSHQFRADEGLHFADAGSFNFHDYLGKARMIADQIRYLEGERIVLQPESNSLGLLLILSLVMARKIPVIDPKRSLDSKDFTFLRESDIAGWHEVKPSTQPMAELLTALFYDLDVPSIVFCTSGSSGLPKLVEKSWGCLLNEVSALRRLYALNQRSSVLSLVSPFHLYGFLHSFLLPFASASSARFLRPELGGADQCDGDLLVMTPALWEVVRELCGKSKFRNIASSGASFGAKRRDDLLDLTNVPEHAWEIFGSTETGGVGYRSLLEDVTAPYRLFRGLEIKMDEGVAILFSPHLFGMDSERLADKIELSDGAFYHHGRIDRIFKYSGKRFSLDEVEVALAKQVKGRVVCRFINDEQKPKGGVLTAYVESEPMDLVQLRVGWSGSNLPFPDRVQFFASLPTDQMGKIAF